MAPKSTLSDKRVLDIRADIAVCQFNDGLSSIMYIMQVLGITIGRNCYNYCVEADEQRIILSGRSLSKMAKEARLSIKSFTKEEEGENLTAEGQLYSPGIVEGKSKGKFKKGLKI